jgi:rRNA maturation protein Rpf1
MWTTSRYCSSVTRSLCMKLARSCGSSYVARGKKTIVQLADLARRKGDSKINILEEKAGKPITIATIEVLETGQWHWFGKTSIDDYEVRRKNKGSL